MPKLSPEAQAKRNASFQRTMAIKKKYELERAAKVLSIADRDSRAGEDQSRSSRGAELASMAEQAAQDETEGWVEVTPAALLAMAPVKQAKALPKNDPRVELARAIVHLLTKVLS